METIDSGCCPVRPGFECRPIEARIRFLIHKIFILAFLRIIKRYRKMQCLFNSIRQKNLSLIQSLMKSFKPNVGHRYSEDAGGKALHTTVSEEEMQALLNAVELGDSSLVRSLIKSNRVDIDYGFDGHYGNTLLHTAAIVGSLDIVKILVEEGHASVNWGNQFDDVPIQYAAFEKHLDIVRYLSEISGIGVTVEQLSKPLAEKPV